MEVLIPNEGACWFMADALEPIAKRTNDALCRCHHVRGQHDDGEGMCATTGCYCVKFLRLSNRPDDHPVNQRKELARMNRQVVGLAQENAKLRNFIRRTIPGAIIDRESNVSGVATDNPHAALVENLIDAAKAYGFGPHSTDSNDGYDSNFGRFLLALKAVMASDTRSDSPEAVKKSE